eukprot:1175988-Prorocentrum_minimum.AAC.4
MVNPPLTVLNPPLLQVHRRVHPRRRPVQHGQDGRRVPQAGGLPEGASPIEKVQARAQGEGGGRVPLAHADGRARRAAQAGQPGHR